MTDAVFWWMLCGILVSLVAGYLLGRNIGRHQEREKGIRVETEKGFLESHNQKLESACEELRGQLAQCLQDKSRLEVLFQEAKNLESSMEKNFEYLSQKILKSTLQELGTDAEKEYTEKQAVLNQTMKDLIQPLRELIEDQEKKVLALEKEHGEQTVSLRDSIKLVVDHCRELNVTNTNLKNALTHSKGRGDWGELELIRLLEESGLIQGVHYETQKQEGQLRPDIKVKLPNGRFIYIDAKTILVNLERLMALSDDQEQAQERKNHANALEREILSLNQKAYDALVDGGIDFVVLYVPRESMLRVALEEKPFLMEQAFKKRVVLASPLILMAVLKTVALGWDQNKLSQNAEEIRKLAKELHKRSSLFLDRFSRVGERLNMVMREFQEAQVAFTGRQGLIPQLKKMEAYGCKSEKEIPELDSDMEPVISRSSEISPEISSEIFNEPPQSVIFIDSIPSS